MNARSLTLNLLLLALTACGLLLLLAPRVRRNRLWRATVTPLASIIGSGFLIVAPLLARTLDGWAPLGMLAIVGLSWLIGGVIRFNIRHVEPRLADPHMSGVPRILENTSDVALTFAYVISVAFYIRLLAAFVLRGIGVGTGVHANLLATAVLCFIGFWGLRYGLRGLEGLEKYAVSIKLAIIGALLAGLAAYDVEWLQSGASLHFIPLEDGWHSLRVLAGMLLVVQGFETSRYLSAEYEADLRIRSMRAAQILSAGIYLVFITLMLPLLQHSTSGLDETAIIRLSAQAAYVLPFLLIIAAAMSQFSAAVADVLGAGGLFSEFVGRGNAPRGAYALITGVSIAIVWTTNIFEIISLASRAFALYYLLQTLLALSVTRYIEARSLRIRYALGFGSLGLILAMVVLFAVPAD